MLRPFGAVLAIVVLAGCAAPVPPVPTDSPTPAFTCVPGAWFEWTSPDPYAGIAGQSALNLSNHTPVGIPLDVASFQEAFGEPRVRVVIQTITRDPEVTARFFVDPHEAPALETRPPAEWSDDRTRSAMEAFVVALLAPAEDGHRALVDDWLASGRPVVVPTDAHDPVDRNVFRTDLPDDIEFRCSDLLEELHVTPADLKPSSLGEWVEEEPMEGGNGWWFSVYAPIRLAVWKGPDGFVDLRADASGRAQLTLHGVPVDENAVRTASDLLEDAGLSAEGLSAAEPRPHSCTTD